VRVSGNFKKSWEVFIKQKNHEFVALSIIGTYNNNNNNNNTIIIIIIIIIIITITITQ